MVRNAIKVYARLKPERSRKNVANYQIRRRPKEHSEEDFLLLTAPQKTTEYIDHRPESWNFSFTRIFEENAPQNDIFESIAQPVIESALDGYNGTIFAYGQTGSGKTYTITGDQKEHDLRGITPRCLQYLFDVIREHPENVYSVEVAYLEIYNENGYDLLDRKQRREFATRLEDLPRVSIQEDEIGRLHLKNLTFHCVGNEQDAFELLLVGDGNRVTADTPMNQQSSRSHCIFTIVISTKQFGVNQYKRSKLHLVDLAGSERVYKCAITGTILNEAKHINLSLHYLEQVIVCLGQESASHIPYRNSLLTAILRDSLGGNCLTTMLATLSVSSFNFEETISTCRFAQRVALIKNDVNLVFDNDIESENKLLRLENGRLKQQIQAVTKQNSSGELTAGEKETLETQIRQFVETNATICWDYDPRKFRYCLESLRRNVVLSRDKNGCMKKFEYYKDMVIQRDKEISLLIDMLKKEREKQRAVSTNGQMDNVQEDSPTTTKEGQIVNDNASAALSNMESKKISEHSEKNSTQLSTILQQTSSSSNEIVLQEDLLKERNISNCDEVHYEMNNRRKDTEKKKYRNENKKYRQMLTNAAKNDFDNLNLWQCNIVNLSLCELRKDGSAKNPGPHGVVDKLQSKLVRNHKTERKRAEMQNVHTVFNETVNENSSGISDNSKIKPSQGTKSTNTGVSSENNKTISQKEIGGGTKIMLKNIIEEPFKETQFFCQECKIFNKPSDLSKPMNFEHQNTEPKSLPDQPVRELQDGHLELNSAKDVYNCAPNVNNYTNRGVQHLSITSEFMNDHRENNRTRNYHGQKCVNDLTLKDTQKASSDYDVAYVRNKIENDNANQDVCSLNYAKNNSRNDLSSISPDDLIPVNNHNDFLEDMATVTKYNNQFSNALKHKTSVEDSYHAHDKYNAKHSGEWQRETHKSYHSNYFYEQHPLETDMNGTSNLSRNLMSTPRTDMCNLSTESNTTSDNHLYRGKLGEKYYPFGNRNCNEQNVQSINEMDVHHFGIERADESCMATKREDKSFGSKNDDDFQKSLPLTGDPEIDEEIIAFYKAKRSGGTY